MDETQEMMGAAMEGSVARLAELLQGDPALIHQIDGDGWTALHLAAYFGHEPAVEALLARGANVGLRSQNALHNLPLHAAAAGEADEGVKCAILARLLGAGADVNAVQHGGFTALHAAAQNGETEMAELLITRGADVNARTERGLTPLGVALEAGQTGMAHLLRQHGTAPTEQTPGTGGAGAPDA